MAYQPSLACSALNDLAEQRIPRIKRKVLYESNYRSSHGIRGNGV